MIVLWRKILFFDYQNRRANYVCRKTAANALAAHQRDIHDNEDDTKRERIESFLSEKLEDLLAKEIHRWISLYKE